MKLLLVTAGSRGDVEPFVALARRAAASGHQVRLALPDRSGVDTVGLDTRSLEADFTALIESQGVSPLAAMRNLRDVVRPVMRGVIVNAARAAREFRPDVIAWHPKVLSAPLAADALGIPHVLVELVPAMTATREFPAAGTVTRALGPLNRLTYRAAAAAGGMFRREVDEAAEVMGVSRARRSSAPGATLLPISLAILSRPADWPDSVVLTGAWRAPVPAPGLDPALSDFLAGGPFAYAGFGSMAAGDPATRGRALVEAARARGIRLLVATGLGGIVVPDDVRGDDVFATRSVDHAAVLPRATAAIHHGGIGTVHAATAAGTVSIVVPFIADQPFWGAMLHRRGLAPAPIPQKRLTAERVAEALASAPGFQAAVDAAAERMAGEDGAAEALGVLERIAARPRTGAPRHP
ncbi:glycosyltransferase [Agromyces marinus]|uniref:Glycosyl transferase family 1 n=1 Tax=Agromyces marinus TaxID=1389020 RepID=A0ABM8GZV7_9MICO|nr:glycosyltransferase [Agromyces marinus]UIP57787.1 O-mycaminosyltylonolide 6-deoxyallosyltransferase [Agromyces marinus]BDZ54034.1 glycosyl transferase family 1 [Agromyces marinus]